VLTYSRYRDTWRLLKSDSKCSGNAADARIDWPKDIASCDSCSWHTFQHTKIISTLLISEILQIRVPTSDAAVQRSRVLSFKGPCGLSHSNSESDSKTHSPYPRSFPILERHSCRFCGFCICVLFVHIPLAFCFYWFLQIFNGFQVAAPLLSLALHNFLFRKAEGVAFPVPLAAPHPFFSQFVSGVHHCGVIWLYRYMTHVNDCKLKIFSRQLLFGSER